MDESKPYKKFLGGQRVLMYLGGDLIEEWMPFTGEMWKEHLKFVFLCQTFPTIIGVSRDISNPSRIIEYRDAKGTVVNSVYGRINVLHEPASCSSTTIVTIRGAPLGNTALGRPFETDLYLGAATTSTSTSYSASTQCTAYHMDEFVSQSRQVDIPRKSSIPAGRVDEYKWFAHVNINVLDGQMNFSIEMIA